MIPPHVVASLSTLLPIPCASQYSVVRAKGACFFEARVQIKTLCPDNRAPGLAQVLTKADIALDFVEKLGNLLSFA